MTNIEYEIEKLKKVIPYCKTRAEAEEIQEQILKLEQEADEACPECGNYERDSYDDDLTCRNEYHDES